MTSLCAVQVALSKAGSGGVGLLVSQDLVLCDVSVCCAGGPVQGGQWGSRPAGQSGPDAV